MRKRGRRRTGSLGSLLVTPMAGVLRTMLIASVLAIALVQARHDVEVHGTILPDGPETAQVDAPPSDPRPALFRIQRPRARRKFGERIARAIDSSGFGGELSR
jgi:hypothetical protein